jgi:hypothetical protein
VRADPPDIPSGNPATGGLAVFCTSSIIGHPSDPGLTHDVVQIVGRRSFTCYVRLCCPVMVDK